MNRLITGRNHYYAPAAIIVMAASISSSPSEKDLNNAIQKAVRKHEMFASKLMLDENGDSYFTAVPSKAIELKIWEGNGKDDLKQLLEEQQRIPFDFTNGELIRFFLIKNKEKTQLAIAANHMAADGLAVIYLIRDIMTALANPGVTYETQPIKLMEDFGYPGDSGLKPVIRLLLAQLNKEWSRKKRIFSHEEYLEMFHSYWKDRQIEMFNAMICGDNLQNLIRKCKEVKISVNSAITAAFLFSLKEDKIGMPVNVRPEAYEGMGNYASGISIQYKWQDKKSFWSNAGSVHREIYKRLKNNHKKYLVLQFIKEMEPTLIDAVYFSKYAGFNDKTALKAMELFKYTEEQQLVMGITNLAKPQIPCKYGNYALDSIDFIPPLIPLNKSVLGVVTVDDKMTISMQYEKSDKSKDYGKVFKNAVQVLRNIDFTK